MSKIHPSHAYSVDVESQQLYDAENSFNVQTNDESKKGTSGVWRRILQIWTKQDMHPSRCPEPPAVQSLKKPTCRTQHRTAILALFVQYKGLFIFVCNIFGSMLFLAGSIMGYGFVYGYSPESCGLVTCALFKSIVTLTGAIFFTFTAAATHILTDAAKAQEEEEEQDSLSWKSNLYVIGGFVYTLGAIAYFPLDVSTRAHKIFMITGATLYVLGSVIYVVAVMKDIIQARKLKEKAELSVMNFLIESWISALYLIGSVMFLAGSIFSYPSLFTPHIYAMFLTGSVLFIVGSFSGFSAELWRYTQRVLRRERILKMRRAVLESIRRTSVTIQRSSSLLKLSTANLHESVLKRANSAPDLLSVGRQLSFTTVGRQLSFSKLRHFSFSSLRQNSFTTKLTQLSSLKKTPSVGVVAKSKLKPTQIAVRAFEWKDTVSIDSIEDDAA